MHTALDKSKALFIRRWGELSGYWGINRTMAELHALLYISADPLCTDDIMAALQISRGNTSMNLRQLVDWGLISRVHRKGDRKEYFTAETDVWEMFQTIVRERRRREVEPIIETIERCRKMVAEGMSQLSDEQRREAEVYQERLASMDDFLSTVNSLLNMLLGLGRDGIQQLRTMLEVAGHGADRA
ncbi:MAG TPA: ArsR family transcriptional regulator [Phycisphaerae bacterium]|nr:ArsR family transcriptional regulator [Phycisphaerae bacterium]HOJ75284.1 ArsR family transcriptional regulator [Phycisphaerae bacterium]HOM53051.1 ArsR family transcriptional regulator [Phycisphaerae bacterium]HON66988.1 ArsR family transcriptional regulator [Phycisphaerae bacterium]HOQ88211.1 ArsR family transcriptional regulator [Phycisphaerae bacterium]